MKKVIKITLVVLALVSMFVLSAFSTFADSSPAVYGFVTYQPTTSDGADVGAPMNLPIFVSQALQNFGVSSSNRKFETYNFVEGFARWRLILPVFNGQYYVSKSRDVELNISVQYPAYAIDALVGDSDSRLFMLPAVYQDNGEIFTIPVGDVDVYVYYKDSITGDVSSHFYSFPLVSNLELTPSMLGLSLPLDDGIDDIVGFNIKWTLNDNLDGSDLTVVLPDYYQPLTIDDEYAIAQSFDDGYRDGFRDGEHSLDDGLGFRVLTESVSAFLGIEIAPGLPIAIIIEGLLGILLFMIISKLILGSGGR